MGVEVRFLPAAEADLDDIWLTIAMASPAAADRTVDAIYDRAMQLSIFPELGPQRPEIVADLRCLTEANYLILYKIGSDEVQIVRVVHGARDVSSLF
jgi:toxin ParE1/3/4